MDTKIEQKIFKKKIYGILSFMLIILALILSVETPNSVAIGDIILRNMGLKVWSNETQGVHYTVIYCFVLFLIGYIFTSHFLSYIYPRFIKRLPVILLILLIAAPFIYSTGNKLEKKLSKGINAIYYNRKSSSCDYKIDSNGNVLLNADLQFENFSKETVKFYIKLISNETFPSNFVSREPITAVNLYSNVPEEFILYPQAVQNFQVNFKAQSNSGFESQGKIKKLDIIIFNDYETKIMQLK